MAQVNWLKRLRDWGQRNPGIAAVVLVLLLYVGYLPTTTYAKLYFDSAAYWNFAGQYYSTGSFSFLSYANLLRGYFFPLLLAPLTQLAAYYEWSAIDAMRMVGAGLAAVVFGWAGPALWQVTTGRPSVALGRRLVFAAFGFVLWRDYFNFSLTDFPALLALTMALVALLRGRGLVSSVLAGGALAAALNMRPVYQAALPAVALLALLPPLGRERWWGLVRGAGLVLGASLLLLPQAYSNDYQADIQSPWVLTTEPGQPNVFLRQLAWGLEFQKYETNIGEDYPHPFMNFNDPHGQVLWKSTGLAQFEDVSQYVRLCAGRPGRAMGVWVRHLFNGMDLQYPTPYVHAVYVPTWPLAWLNYSIIWAGLLVLLLRRWHRPAQGWARPVLVLLALLTPCLVTLVTAMECRFLLPLHLLLSAAVAFGAAPWRWWQAATAKGRAAVLVSYVVVVGAGFWASATAQRELAVTPRLITNDLPGQFLWESLGD